MKTKENRVAIYGRVSTDGQSVDLQVNELREYATRRDWQVIEEYLDVGVSGAKESRPALNRLMADARQRKFDILVVWKIDRFGRSLRHLVNSLAELESLGVSFVSLRDSIDLSSPSGVLMFQLIAAMSQFERSLIQERVRAGIRNARNKGRRLGRPRLEMAAGSLVYGPLEPLYEPFRSSLGFLSVASIAPCVPKTPSVSPPPGPPSA